MKICGEMCLLSLIYIYVAVCRYCTVRYMYHYYLLLFVIF
jgi:hypothetical protein